MNIKKAALMNRLMGLFAWAKKNNAPAQPKSYRQEIYGLVLFSMALAIFCALFSFRVEDKELLSIDNADLHNWIGPLGFYLAYGLFQGVGVFAYALCLFGFWLSVRFIFLKKPVWSIFEAASAFLCYLGVILLFAKLDRFTRWFSYPPAGRFGAFWSRHLEGLVSTLGLWIVSLTIILCGLLLLRKKPLFHDDNEAFFLKVRALAQKMAQRVRDRFKRQALPGPSIRLLDPIEDLVRVPKEAPGLAFFERKKNPVPIKPLPKEELHIIERDKLEGAKAVMRAEKEKALKEHTMALPPLQLLDYDAPTPTPVDGEKIRAQAEKLHQVFLEFGIEGKVREIRPGPVVTMFEFVPAPGIKLSKIAALSDDIAMAMSAVHVRVVAPIPGKGAVGIELPNEKREVVYLKEIVAHEAFRKQPHKLCMAVGKDVEGKPYYMNLADMPHVLLSGTTGSGKSVSMNAMICSILYRSSPKDVRFLMIDPKMLELSIYNGIPHLLLPPIIDAKKSVNALRWAVKEMDLRYQLMKELAVRDIDGYNQKLKETNTEHIPSIEGRKHEHLPYIVIVVDEYADLIAVAGKDVEAYVMRLAQKARACGIHVMLATQRPSVDVITGVIKANFPVRMGFRLASSHDSKTIINRPGAEKLLGRGDVLIMPPGTSDLYRVHGAFISEKELLRVVGFLKNQSAVQYDQSIVESIDNSFESIGEKGYSEDEMDEKYVEAIEVVRQFKKCSTSFIQRHLGVGYNRAARIVEHMEKMGVVGPVQNAKGDREIFLEP